MNKNVKSRGREQSAQKQLNLPPGGLVRAALWDTVMIAGLAFVKEELEAGRTALCRTTLRPSGGAAGVAVGSRAEFAGVGRSAGEVERPRTRSVDGHEMSLSSWRAWSSRDPLDERAFEQIVLGVSTRGLCALMGSPTQRVRGRVLWSAPSGGSRN